MKAMLINRVEDIGLLLAMFIIIKEFGTLEYSSIYSLLVAADINNLTIICLLLFFWTVAKSAQLGLVQHIVVLELVLVRSFKSY